MGTRLGEPEPGSETDEVEVWEVEKPEGLIAFMQRKRQERREAKTRWRKVRLRRLEWFPLPEGVQGRHGVSNHNDEPLVAALYLLSIIAVPMLFAFALWHPWPLPDMLYGLPVAGAGFMPWIMAQGVSDLANRKRYSFFALRAQLWVQLGGAAPSAVGCIRRWRSARRSGLVAQESSDEPQAD